MAYYGHDFCCAAGPRRTRYRSVEALVIAKHDELLEQQRSNTQEIEHLKLVIEKYRRMIFGRKSEKLTGQLEQLELRLEELETAQAAEEAASEAAQPGSTSTVAKRRPALHVNRFRKIFHGSGHSSSSA